MYFSPAWCISKCISKRISLLPGFWGQLDKVTKDSNLVLDFWTLALLLVAAHHLCVAEQILRGKPSSFLVRIYNKRRAENWEEQEGKQQETDSAHFDYLAEKGRARTGSGEERID